MTEEENSLENALRLAADEPAYRPDFYKVLLESIVYVIGQSERKLDAKGILEAGEKLSIQNWQKDDGSPFIPFFSSLISLRKILKKETSYMALPARGLFENTKGVSLVLNPTLKYGKEFFPTEIEALLKNQVNVMPEQRITQKETQVLIGQPANYPSKMVDSLIVFLSQRSNVKAAYLVLMHDPSQDVKPHLLVGIEADGDIAQVIREAGAVAAGTAPNGESVDLFHVSSEERGLSDSIKKTVKPFYERTWGGKIKSFLRIPKSTVAPG